MGSCTPSQTFFHSFCLFFENKFYFEHNLSGSSVLKKDYSKNPDKYDFNPTEIIMYLYRRKYNKKLLGSTTMHFCSQKCLQIKLL